MADVDAHGEVVNTYTGRHRVARDEPAAPWAVYLAGTDHRYRLLAFDLDAKTPSAAAAAERDADVLAGLLRDVGLEHVVCVSGPVGGRHVWVALAESVDAETVAALARLARHLCPTLDLSPLSNPVTGCVRPPGAPHRAGGHSTLVRGDLAALLSPTGTAAQVGELVARLARLVDDAEPARRIDARTPIPVDEHARRYLPGPKRPLPAVSAAALREDAAAGDASAALWRVLIGAAASRWHHADIAALVPTAPGLEHVRTRLDARTGTRLPRAMHGPSGQVAVLARQWDKAVSYVASSDRQIGDDPTFDARAGAIAAHIHGVQARADASPGRWAAAGGPADRRVLDALCVLALQAVRADVEADTRRLALLTGIGRETARTALLRLAADGWIAHNRPAVGPHAAHWTLDPDVLIPSATDVARSQADPRRAAAGSAWRTTLLTTLTTRLADVAHDLFTPGPALGHLTGNLYARLTGEPQTAQDVASAAGLTAEQARSVLERLHDAGVLLHTREGWRRRRADPRGPAATRLRVAGRLAEREARYRLERELWAWWQAEQAWMTAPRRPTANRRPGRGQLSLLPEDGTNAYGAHPRRPDGRADYRAARRELTRDAAGRAASPGPTAAEALVRAVLGGTRVA